MPVSRRRSMLRVRRASLLLAGLLAAWGPSAAAQEGAPAETGIELVSQPAWVAPGDAFPLRVRVSGAGPTAEIRLTVHSALVSRTGFERTVEGEGLGSVVDRAEVRVADATPGRDGTVVAPFRLRGPGESEDEHTLRVRGTGVYPIRVELVDDTGNLDEFVTWLVAVATTTYEHPLAVSWIWSVAGTPAVGAPTPADDVAFAPGGRLDRIATLLAGSEVPLTVVPGPETLEHWEALAAADEQVAAGFTSVTEALRGPDHQVLPAPYVPLDLPRLEASGLGEQAGEELIVGREVLQRTTGVRVDPRTWWVDPVDAAALSRLRSAFADRFVLRDTALEPVARNLTPALPFTLDSGGRTYRAAATDSGLEALLEGEGPPALRAQRLLAGLSLVALEQPSTSRGVVLATPTEWDPDAAAVGAVLRGLDEHPLVAASTVEAYFAALPDDTIDDEPLVRTLAPPFAPPEPHPVTPEEYRDAEAALEAFAVVVGPDDPRVVNGERALLVSLSSAITPARAHAELASIEASAQGFLSGIATTQKRITLTAREADVPLTFRNDTGRPVRVRVRLESSKLLFPEGAETVLALPEGSSTHSFRIETRASGTFPMTVTITSEDRRLPVGSPTRITVRSAVFSGVGTLLTVGALLFLAVWWATHWRRSRRARIETPPAGATPAPIPAAP